MPEEMKNQVKKYIILIVGLLVMSFGVAFSIKGALGTSPISSLPYVTSLMSGFTVGQTTIILHCVLILLQVIILRKRFKLIQLLQLPVALVFGWFTDLSIDAIGWINCNNYAEQWLCCAVGIILVGFGVNCEVSANVVTLAGEGFVLAVCRVAPIKFPKMKIIFDCTLVAISVMLSLIFLHSLQGVREGTVAAALLVGIIAKFFNKPMGLLAKKWIPGK